MSSSIPRVFAALSRSDLKSVPHAALAPLTARQAEVLGWIAAGKRNREIAKLLHCSVRTVEKHVENIMRVIRAETRSALAGWWHKRRRSLEQRRTRASLKRSVSPESLVTRSPSPQAP